MTVDFIQRKAAKKGWRKKAKIENNGETREIRERKRRGKRRLCQGMCYKDPSSQITVEDKLEGWENNSQDQDQEDDEDKVDEVDNDERRGSHAQTSPSNVIKLSTSISLMSPQGNQGTKIVAKKAVRKSPLAAGGRKEASRVVPPTLSSFDPTVAQSMVFLGHEEPTPIQEQCWPVCCEGKDVLGVAQPGSGKTLAYLLPALARFKMTNISRAILLSFTFIKQQEQGDSEKKEGKDIKFGPRILILVPTRELAAQVAAQARQLRAVSGLATACLYGGVPKESQVELLQKNPQIIVATCGRLLDLVDDNLLSLSLVEYLVLDEADKMLGLGFKAQLDRLQGMLLPGNGKVERAQVVERAKGQKAANKGGEGGGSKRPQVLLFTATMPESVDEAAGHWLREPVGITVSHSADSISRTITQVVHVCAEHKKPAKLLKHLLSIKETGSNLRNPHRVLVFCNRIKTVRYLHDLISKEGLRCTMLHGQRSQQEREAAVLGFKAGKVQVLVATDVAARGLDIRRLPYVVSYDFPSNLETYIHRVGRTGRLSANGHSFSFFTRNLAKLAGPLMTLLQEHGQTIDPNLQQLAVAWSEAVKKAGDEGLLQAPVKEEGEGEGEGEELEEEGWEEGRMALDIDEGLISKDVIKRTSNEKPPAVARKEKPIVSHPASLAAPAPPAEEAFVPSSKFQGSKQGYLFKMGASGLGYYRDQQEMKKNSRSSIPKNQASEPKQMATNRSNDPIIGSGKKRKNWDSDSEDDFGPLTGARGKGKKSLPGRLRKKLKAK